MTRTSEVHVLGGGLAGSEAAWALLKAGFPVVLHERRPLKGDGAHETGLLGELVCSNSLKGERLDNACGLLKEEMRLLGSLTMEAASFARVPAGNALAVDRQRFASFITERLLSTPGFRLVREEVSSIPEGEPWILATGPLTDGPLLSWLETLLGQESLHFYDASAPIVRKDSIDMDVSYFKSRFGQGDDSYINCPFTKEEYFLFVRELVSARRVLDHGRKGEFFEGCLPIEVMAARDVETLRHGPLKPFGLRREEGHRPYAVAQLRQDDALGELYNLVGFQTNLAFPEQKRVFSLIPGLGKAEFVRYGLMHRNSYVDAGKHLSEDLSFVSMPSLFLAGQLSGVEGYVESAATGILAGRYLARRLMGLPFHPLPLRTMLGALLSYILFPRQGRLEPMNANWGLLGVHKEGREKASEESLALLKDYLREEGL